MGSHCTNVLSICGAGRLLLPGDAGWMEKRCVSRPFLYWRDPPNLNSSATRPCVCVRPLRLNGPAPAHSRSPGILPEPQGPVESPSHPTCPLPPDTEFPPHPTGSLPGVVLPPGRREHLRAPPPADQTRLEPC